MTVSTDRGMTQHTATVPEEFFSSLDLLRDFVPYILILGLATTLISWAIHRLAMRKTDPKKAFTAVARFGWAPGLILTFATMGGLYPAITGIWIVLISLFSIGVRDGHSFRTADFLAVTAASAMHFFLA